MRQGRQQKVKKKSVYDVLVESPSKIVSFIQRRLIHSKVNFFKKKCSFSPTDWDEPLNQQNLFLFCFCIIFSWILSSLQHYCLSAHGNLFVIFSAISPVFHQAGVKDFFSVYIPPFMRMYFDNQSPILTALLSMKNFHMNMHLVLTFVPLSPGLPLGPGAPCAP